MTNKHIELVKKWLADKDSVSPKELKTNMDDAWNIHTAAFDAARAAVDATRAEAVYATRAVSNAAAHADYDADFAAEVASHAADVKYWIARYEELTNDK